MMNIRDDYKTKKEIYLFVEEHNSDTDASVTEGNTTRGYATGRVSWKCVADLLKMETKAPGKTIGSAQIVECETLGFDALAPSYSQSPKLITVLQDTDLSKPKSLSGSVVKKLHRVMNRIRPAEQGPAGTLSPSSPSITRMSAGVRASTGKGFPHTSHEKEPLLTPHLSKLLQQFIMSKRDIAPVAGAVSAISSNVSTDDSNVHFRSLEESTGSFKGLFNSIHRIDSAILLGQFINDNPQTINNYEAN